MTVENLGAYLDLPAPRHALVIHQPGWNTRLAARLIGLLPPTPTWWHFGDLDPEGLRIQNSLGDAQRRPRPFIPHWWQDYIDSHGLPLPDGWPAGDDLDRRIAPAQLMAQLQEQRVWMEQEAILLDPRLMEDLARL